MLCMMVLQARTDATEEVEAAAREQVAEAERRSNSKDGNGMWSACEARKAVLPVQPPAAADGEDDVPDRCKNTDRPISS